MLPSVMNKKDSQSLEVADITVSFGVGAGVAVAVAVSIEGVGGAGFPHASVAPVVDSLVWLSSAKDIVRE